MSATIILCTYNSIDGLRDSLQSVISQTYRPLEIIVADDSDTECYREKIKGEVSNFSCGDCVIRYICNMQTLGTVENLNNAIRQTKSRYILPLFPKDLFINDCVVSKVCSILAAGVLVVFAKRRMIDVFRGSLDMPLDWPNKRGRELIRDLLVNGNVFSGASTYYRREYFEAYGFFDSRYLLLEDFPNAVRVFREGLPHEFASFCSVVYDQSGVSSSIKSKSIQSQKLLSDLIRFYLESLRHETSWIWKRRIGMVLREYHSRRYGNEFSLVTRLLIYPDVTIYRLLRRLFS